MRITAAAIFITLLGCGSKSAATVDVDGGGGSGGSGSGSGSGGQMDAPGSSGAAARTVFVVPFENKSAAKIYGNSNAPYLNGLITGPNAKGAQAMKFQDELPSLDSEPHYIYMEAGTNKLPDYTFGTDDDAGSANHTTATAHLATQITAAGLTWTSYQQGIATGDCPVASNGDYAAKHDPFVFFDDVSGPGADGTGAPCKANHKSTDDLAADLAAGHMANYVFITPDLCNDMHGAIDCPSLLITNANIKAGDDWAAAHVPALIDYTHTHDAIVFLVWDEGDSTNLMPFIALGDHVKAGPDSTAYNHGSQVKTIETFLGLPILPSVTGAAVMDAMFEPGYLAP